MEEVSFLNGKTRLYGIVGDPIEQVRSPEMVTHELHSRGINAVLLPIHIPQAHFDEVLPSLLRIANLDGLIFTIPFKARAMRFAAQPGTQASAVNAINVIARNPKGMWTGEIFDGLGCVEAFRRRGYGLQGKSVMLIGLGGAGSAICAAVAAEMPASLRIFDLDAERCARMAETVRRISPTVEVTVGKPDVEGIDVLLNASPVGMLDDRRLPIEAAGFNKNLIVFDAIVKPEQTPLLALAESCGCRVVRGREMMRGQISRIVDYFVDATTL
jgi:shikimate dehydrogenase